MTLIARMARNGYLAHDTKTPPVMQAIQRKNFACDAAKSRRARRYANGRRGDKDFSAHAERFSLSLPASLRAILSFLPPISFGAAQEITVSYASLGAAYMDHVAAMEKGYLAEEGLSVKIMRSGGGSATQTLLSGQIHFSSSAGSALSAALRGGPLKIVYTNQSKPTYKLLANKPEIKTLQDLIGKKIAINTFGDTGHLATLLLLKKYRMDPKQFVFIAVRSEARFPAFLSGSIDAAPLSPRDIAQIGQARTNTIADISKEIQLVWNGVAVSNRLLAENPALVERFLRALAKGREFARRYKEPTIQMVAKYTPFPPEALLVDYETALVSMTEDGTVPDDVLKEEVLIRAELIKAPSAPDPAKLYDYSIIRKVYAEIKKGWKPKL